MKQPAGMANYLINALNELSRQKPEWTFYLLTNGDVCAECSNQLMRNANIIYLNKPFTKIGTVWYATRLFFILKDLKPDFFWAPANILPPMIPQGIKTILTVHDLVAKDYRYTMTGLNRMYNDLFFDRSVVNADIIWCVSEYSKSEISSRYSHRRCTDVFVGSGVDKNVFQTIYIPDDEKRLLLEKYGIGQKYMLCVGSIEPRKNLEYLLSLMPTLATEGYCLIIVGAKGWGKSRIFEIINSEGYPRDSISFLGFMEMKELVKIYNCATLFISASLNEGFGLPQLEAMNCGCPVVCSHNSAMIEMVHGVGMTIEGWNPDNWCSAIREVTANRAKYAAQGIEKSLNYDWHLIVQNFIVQLEKIKS